MEFTFTAINPTGGQVKEQIQSETESQAIQRLQSQGYIILSLDAVSGKARRKSGGGEAAGAGAKGKGERKGGLNATITLPWNRKIKLDQLTLLTREFSIMIETGVPIVDAVSLLRDHADSPILKDALDNVFTDLCEGKTLVQALSAHPNIFPKIYVDMVRTAETGGSLDETLNQAADYQELALEMRRKVAGALTYPAILGIVSVKVVLFMLIFLLPQFKDMFAKMGGEIPIQTKLLMGMSDLLRAQWWLIPAVVFGGITGFKTAMRFPAGRLLFTKITHKIPILGDIIRKMALSRMLRALGTLSGAGVSLLIALETAQQTAQDMIFEASMTQVRQKVEEGESLSEAVIETGVFPPMICQMIAVGEKSGQLSSVMLRIASFYERDVSARLKVLTAVIEPLMIVVLGVVVGFIATSIIAPIYSMVGSIK